MDDDARPINVNQYNSEEGKLIASIKWLITRIYEDNGIPDMLRELFYRDEEGNLNLTTAVASALTNGSLYSQAASKILRDPSLVNQSHGTVLRALSRSVEIEVRDCDGALVTEMALVSANPVRVSTHLALIDAMMTAHMKSIISIERVVQCVSEYTPVEKREEPMDCVDALLFWINKICLLVRDDVERSGMALKGLTDATIPEMEDLYEDLCDGTCITALASFYRPHELVLTDICFNDPISLQDCRYNLGLLRHFCEMCLPWNPFHFEIEDILYLHESLQPNINAFLADLFFFFEPAAEPAPVQMQSPTQRRFVPIQGIPDLRAQNLANRPLHPPRVRNSIANRDRNLSISSQDSLMTNKSNERGYRPNALPPGVPTMSFGAMTNDIPSPLEGNLDRNIDQSRGDPTNMTAIRLAMHQKRQEYEQKHFMENSATEAERQKAGKDAFFKLMKTNQDPSRARAQTEMAPQTASLGPAVDHPAGSVMMSSPVAPGSASQSSGATREEILSAQVQCLQEQIQNMALANNAINRPHTGMSHAISQPSIHNDLMYGQSPLYRPNPPTSGTLPHPHHMHHDPHQMYAMPYGYPAQQQPTYDHSNYAMPHPVSQSQNMPSQNFYSPMRYPGPLPNAGMSYSMYEHQQQPTVSPQQMYGGQSFDDYAQHSIPNANTFHLHQANASNSRLDPPLELNRNLTNWGLTYRAQTRTPRKTWAEFKSEHDLRNHPDVVPQEMATPPQPLPQKKQSRAFEVDLSQQSPPRDPDFATPSHSASEMHMQRKASVERPKNGFSSSNGNNSKSIAEGFTIADSSSAVDMTPEMAAKKAALFANQMKRKQQIPDKVEEKEARLNEKRLAEMAKQELAEQKKIEKELRRQKLLEEYKRKKLEKEFPDLATPSPTMSARSNSSLQRGHSQPPFVTHAKSQSNMTEIQSRTMGRSMRAKSNAGDENSTPRIAVASTAEPSVTRTVPNKPKQPISALKLFAKHVPKSNRSLIMNSLQYSIFPGTVSTDQRIKVQEALAQSDSKHFLVLFRDVKCQYRGLYTWDGASDTAHKVHGMGPKVVREDMMSLMFKYDSGSKHFNKIPAKHLSPTIDGFTIQDQLWQKPKIPHSNAR